MLWTIALILIVLWAGGAGERHHAERIHSCPAGNCGYRDTAQHHSGAAFDVAGADDEQRLSCHTLLGFTVIASPVCGKEK